jgi:hypothetical protein
LRAQQIGNALSHLGKRSIPVGQPNLTRIPSHDPSQTISADENATGQRHLRVENHIRILSDKFFDDSAILSSVEIAVGENSARKAAVQNPMVIYGIIWEW